MNPALVDKLRQIHRDWRRGRHYGYPPCCIAMYCWDRLWDLPPSLTRCCSQGVDPPESSCEWVPCGVLHHGGSPLGLAERLGRIAAFWMAVLRPASPMWERARRNAHPPCPPYIGRAGDDGWPVDLEWARASIPGPTEAAYQELDEQLSSAELAWH